MAPHATEMADESLSFSGTHRGLSGPPVASLSPIDYSYTYDNRDGYTPEFAGSNWQYDVAEHILWAPRKVRVASIGAGASGIMLCYKKEKEFGDDIDLVVYDRESSRFALFYAQ